VERQITAYGTYFLDFYDKQDSKTREKIDYVLDLVKHIRQVPIKFLKHLEGTDGLYEIKVSTSNKSIRIFCFFDSGRLVILTNCFVKKTQKTPRKELKLALRLMQQYFDSKSKNK
jgi:phage-related protein